MLRTGWTRQQLEDSDPRTVAALHYRLRAEMLWPEDGLQAMHAKTPDGLSGQARISFTRRRIAIQKLHESLFPADEDEPDGLS
jgi:hypothetical protein